MTAQPPLSLKTAVSRLVPFVHVADVDASLAFYSFFGLERESTMQDPEGRTFWALARNRDAEIMLARASGPIDAEQQAVLFYLYSQDINALRRHLLDSGLHDAGTYTGKATPDDTSSSAYRITQPEYMPGGELRVVDPDGYVILVGQLE
ncbi:MAG: VOC family protein [Phycisphaerales bacterium]